MADVFISYARSDQVVARRVARTLQADGLDVWWDADLPAHRSYSEEIERNLEAAKAIVVLWSAPAAKSQWVRAEADFARNAGKLVQAQVDATLPPIPFNQIQCANLKGWRGAAGHPGWSKLIGSVRALVSGETVAPEPIGKDAWWKQRRFQAAAAVLAIALLASLWLVPQWLGSGDAKRPVVAVLPFESFDRRDEGLVAGIWEDTRQALSRNPQLLVLGPNTSQKLAESEPASRRAADYLVEASVRSAGDRIRVSANLIRTEDSAQVWSQSFERRVDNVFQLQQQIAGEIEGHIRGRLAQRGGTLPEHIVTSGEAYALYSDARTAVRKRQYAKFDLARKQLEEVLRKDPNFAPGWATLSVVKRMAGEDAEADARRAVSLAPSLAAAHAAVGFSLGEGPAAQASLRQALKLDPNDIEAMNWLANSLDRRIHTQEVLALYTRIAEIEPLWWPALFNKTSLLFELGNREAVEEEIARLRKLGDASLADAVQMQLMQRTGDLSGVVSIGLRRYKTTTDPEERERIALPLFPTLLLLGHTEIADKIFPPPSPYIHHIRANDPRGIPMFEATHSPKEFWRYGMLGIMGSRVYLLNGQGPRLANIYRQAVKSPNEFEALIGKARFPDYAPMAALAVRSAGDEEEARKLLALAEQRASETEADPLDKLISLARIHAVQGQTDQAIGELSQAVRGGWLPPYLPINTDIATDPPLRELSKDPRFEPLRQRILGHIAKERAELGPVSLN